MAGEPPRTRSEWDDAYANADHIPDAASYPPRWAEQAAAFREALLAEDRARLGIAYGDEERQRYDLFLPEGAPRGLIAFVHGGYWKAFDRSSWSHLAAGGVSRGFAVALPGYTLCPQARIGEITHEIGQCLVAMAREVPGALRLAGHSAGGHLVARMACRDAPIPGGVRERIAKIVSISGLHDLRPLLQTSMNEVLRLDEAEARAESPALLDPSPETSITCWVGADERPDFVRQNALLPMIWQGLAGRVETIEEPDRHHFDVVEGLEQPDGALLEALLA